MEWIPVVISICAIFISIITLIVEVYSNKKINNINLEAELSRDTIKSYLTEKFPNAVNKICFPNGQLSNVNDLQNELTSLMSDLRYFKYGDKKFYDELQKKVQHLENYIVQNSSRTFTIDRQSEVLKTIFKELTNIYNLVKTKYKNG